MSEKKEVDIKDEAIESDAVAESTSEQVEAITENDKEPAVDKKPEVDDESADDSESEQEKIIIGLSEENADLKDQMARLQAEMENTRRRSRQEVDKARKFGMEKLVEELVPVLDSLGLGLQAIDEHSDDVEKAKEGYEMIASMFTSILDKSGVKVIDPQGEAFNPELHQAMTTEPSDEVKPNHVLRVFQKGYRLHERLVRPAMVVISVAKTKESEEKAVE